MQKLDPPCDMSLTLSIDSETHNINIQHKFNRNNEISNERYASLLNILCSSHISQKLFECLSLSLLKLLEKEENLLQVHSITQHWTKLRNETINMPLISPSQFLNLHFDKPEATQ